MSATTDTTDSDAQTDRPTATEIAARFDETVEQARTRLWAASGGREWRNTR